MHEFFEDEGFRADIQGLRSLYPYPEDHDAMAAPHRFAPGNRHLQLHLQPGTPDGHCGPYLPPESYGPCALHRAFRPAEPGYRQLHALQRPAACRTAVSVCRPALLCALRIDWALLQALLDPVQQGCHCLRLFLAEQSGCGFLELVPEVSNLFLQRPSGIREGHDRCPPVGGRGTAGDESRLLQTPQHLGHGGSVKAKRTDELCLRPVVLVPQQHQEDLLPRVETDPAQQGSCCHTVQTAGTEEGVADFAPCRT